MAVRWVLTLCILSAAWAQGATQAFSVEVGERKRFSIEPAEGIVLDAPRVADVEMAGGNAVVVLGKSEGKATVDVWTRGGKWVQYPLEVRAGRAPEKPAASPYQVEWTAPVFGGRRIPEPQCELPFKSARAGALFEQARSLLAKEEVAPAVGKLEEVARLEPEAATTQLFLGAALAKLKQPERGILAFETFALSCNEDPRYPAVVRILQQYRAKQGRR